MACQCHPAKIPNCFNETRLVSKISESHIYKLDFGGEFEFLIKVNRKENYEKQCYDENCQNDSNPDFFLCCRPLKKRFNFG